MLFSKKDNANPPEMDAFTLSRQGSTGSEENSARVTHLEARVERLTALVETLWSILESKSSLTDKHLKARLENIMELRAHRSAEKNACRKCNQKNPVSKENCLYCGSPLPKPTESDESPFNF